MGRKYLLALIVFNILGVLWNVQAVVVLGLGSAAIHVLCIVIHTLLGIVAYKEYKE